MNKEAAAYYQQAGMEAAFESMGLQKEAFIPAVMAGARAMAPMLGQAARFARGGAKSVGKAFQAGGQAFAQQAPGVANALNKAKNVAMNPWAQTAAVGATMV